MFDALLVASGVSVIVTVATVLQLAGASNCDQPIIT